MAGIETGNMDAMVAIRGKRVAMLKFGAEFDADAALRIAAWLVCLAEPNATYSFNEVLDAVQNT